MRFSDMMGSGSGRPESPAAPTEDAGADALAPYLETGAPAEPGLEPGPEPVEAVVDPAPVPVAAPEAVPPGQPTTAWVPDRGAPRVEYAPLSDDLLPRRR